MKDEAPVIPVGLIEVALNSKHSTDLLTGRETHLPALHFVGEVLPHTQDADWICEIAAGYLPEDYDGNTLEEIPGMVEDSLKKGYAEPARSKTKTDKMSAAQVANLTISTSDQSLFHTDQNEAFVRISSETGEFLCHPVRSQVMKSYIRLKYFKATGKTLGRDALTEVLDLLEAKALFEAPQENVHVRIAGDEHVVYYDLGLAENPFVEITASGWSIVNEVPVNFHRPSGFVPQILPSKDGDLDDLRQLLHLDDDVWVLILAYIISCLKPQPPYVVLLLSGGHGSGKSKVSELIKRIVDPNALAKTRLPKDEHTLAIQAAMARLLVYDNTSAVRWDLSDALCAMLTGGGFSTRKYYTDDEQRMFKNARPIIINGIGEFASQHDLLDRAIAVKLSAIEPGRRRTEKVIDTEFEKILPGVLGKLFDIVSTALQCFDEVEPPTTVRQADAAQWLVASETETGLEPGTFLQALEDSVRDVTIDNTINNPLVRATITIVDREGPKRIYEGTIGDLHDKLRDDYGRLDPLLPKTPAHLSNALQRLQHGMAEIGLMVELLPRNKMARPVRIWIEENEHIPEYPGILRNILGDE